MINFLIILKKLLKKNKIKLRSFGYSKKSDIRFVNLKKNKDHFFLKLFVDKKKFS